MKNKKAFTLVELLAVIVILAVILVIAVPQVLDVIDTTKIGSLESSAKLIASTAEKKYAEFLALGKDTSTIQCSDVTKLNDKDYGTCTISFDDKGEATVSIKGKENGKFEGLKCEGTKDNMVCEDIPPLPVLNCTFEGEMVQGAEYVNGQYTYKYKQGYDIDDTFEGWVNKDFDGWAVILTDKESTVPVTSKLCTYINDKPIVSMRWMFAGNKATSIDLSSFNTSNVTSMFGMFAGSAATSLDLSNFDTSNVTDMSAMFSGSKTTSLDLSSFDTSNVTDMSYMFQGSAETNLDLSNFDTSNVINMSGMFMNSAATSLDLSNFDTSNVINMYGMFMNSAATSIDLSSFDTSNVTDMESMFEGSTAISLDLSSFDTKNVSYMSWMFSRSSATTGYARTQADADKFNSSSNKPSTLTFVVKGS